MKTPLDCIMERENNGNMIQIMNLNHKINRKGKLLASLIQAEKDCLKEAEEPGSFFESYSCLCEEEDKAIVFLEETVKTPVGGLVHRYPDDCWESYWEKRA